LHYLLVEVGHQILFQLDISSCTRGKTSFTDPERKVCLLYRPQEFQFITLYVFSEILFGGMHFSSWK